MSKQSNAGEDDEYEGVYSYGSDQERVADSRRRLIQRVSCIRILACVSFILVTFVCFSFWKILSLQNHISEMEKVQQASLALIRKTERIQMRQQLESNNRNIPSFAKAINGIVKSTISQVDIFSADDSGIRKVQLLYETQGERKFRYKFNEERENFIDSENKLIMHLAKYNFIQSQGANIEGLLANAQQWERLNSKYNLTHKQELSMCILVPGYNNRANFRIQYNLNSLFTQNYTNYKAVIINDASTDGSDSLYRKYFKIYNISSAKYTYIFNKERVTALENLYNGILGQCQNYQIIITLDADDQFIGRNVLKTLNAVYQTRLLGVVYSNFYWYQQKVKIESGFTKQYTEEQKNGQAYRDIQMRFSHLRSFKRQLFMQVDPRDLQDKEGNFYKIAYDMAMFLPMLELACSQILRLEEHQYLYNIGTGINDYTKDNGQLQRKIDLQIRAKPKYNCSNKYKLY